MRGLTSRWLVLLPELWRPCGTPSCLDHRFTDLRHQTPIYCRKEGGTATKPPLWLWWAHNRHHTSSSGRGRLLPRTALVCLLGLSLDPFGRLDRLWVDPERSWQLGTSATRYHEPIKERDTLSPLFLLCQAVPPSNQSWEKERSDAPHHRWSDLILWNQRSDAIPRDLCYRATRLPGAPSSYLCPSRCIRRELK